MKTAGTTPDMKKEEDSISEKSDELKKKIKIKVDLQKAFINKVSKKESDFYLKLPNVN